MKKSQSGELMEAESSRQMGRYNRYQFNDGITVRKSTRKMYSPMDDER